MTETQAELLRAFRDSGLENQDNLLKYLKTHELRIRADVALIAELVEPWADVGCILEVGGYPFLTTWLLKQQGFAVTSLDLDPSRMASFVRKHCLDVVKCDLEREAIPFPDGSFRLVVFNEVFEHLRDPIGGLREIRRVLTPDGKLILTTPNLYSFNNVFQFLTGRGIAGDAFDEFNKLYILGHMGHVREYTQHDVKRFLEGTGFRVERAMLKYYRIMPLRRHSPLMKLGIPVRWLLWKLFPILRPFQTVVASAAPPKKQVAL